MARTFQPLVLETAVRSLADDRRYRAAFRSSPNASPPSHRNRLSSVVAPSGPEVRIPLAPAARQSANHRFRRRFYGEIDRPECVLKSRALVPRYYKFESGFLQRRVRCEPRRPGARSAGARYRLVCPAGALLFRRFALAVGSVCRLGDPDALERVAAAMIVPRFSDTGGFTTAARLVRLDARRQKRAEFVAQNLRGAVDNHRP
jgi:hypothetical protein